MVSTKLRYLLYAIGLGILTIIHIITKNCVMSGTCIIVTLECLVMAKMEDDDDKSRDNRETRKD